MSVIQRITGMTAKDLRDMADAELPKSVPSNLTPPVAFPRPTVPFRTIERLGKCHAADLPQFRVRVGDDIYEAVDEPTAIFRAVAAVSKYGPVTIHIVPPLQ